MVGAALAGGVTGLDVEATLPAALADALVARSRRVPVSKGQMVIAQGSAADDVYLILSGQVRVSVFAANGRETFLRDMGPGRLLGELAAISGEPRSASVVVTEPSLLAVISAQNFRSFLQDVPGAGLWLSTQLAARVRNLTEKSSELASLPVVARLASELLRLADGAVSVGDGCLISQFPTHAELAARIGTHREAISRELGQLARDGLARQNGRRLEIHSLARLHAHLERQSR
jgi:CRP-like cAMP-binding protein